MAYNHCTALIKAITAGKSKWLKYKDKAVDILHDYQAKEKKLREGIKKARASHRQADYARLAVRRGEGLTSTTRARSLPCQCRKKPRRLRRRRRPSRTRRWRRSLQQRPRHCRRS